jgi:tetratricopeptide (TPR) repeat protein
MARTTRRSVRLVLGFAILVALQGCGGGAAPHAEHATETAAAGPRVIGNLGAYSHPVTTSSPEAQRYFDQGLRLVYGFNHDEARLAFEQAGRIDPDCAMAWWGVAYSLGSNYNQPGDPERDRQAYAAMEKAKAAAPKASERDQAYVAALAVRYASDAPADRRHLDEAYAAAMGDLARRFPDDLDAQTMYAESLMDLQPWDLWTADGKPKGRTVEIVTVLEGVLARDPQHPGANHYYIHAVEASKSPERALPAADRLRAMSLTGAGHLVHMPSHIYIRTGRYPDAYDANVEAAAADEAYIAKWKVEGVYPSMYYPHNVHFMYAAASFEGRGTEAISAARRVHGLVPIEMLPHMPMLEGFLAVPYFALARFGHWDEILAEPAPPADQGYVTGIWHYVRGLAYSAKGDPKQAKAELAALDAIRAKAPKDWRPTEVNTGRALLGVASDHLAGEIAAKAKRWNVAIRDLEAAVKLEDGLRYMEPPDWYLPMRQALGDVLLRAGRPRQAEAVFRQDLEHNRENGWALRGLAQSLRRQGKTAEAAQVEERLSRAWARADPGLVTAGG